jgi:hypothetical protein
MTLQEMEKQLIAATLKRTEGNIKEAASILGIDRSTMYEKITHGFRAGVEARETHATTFAVMNVASGARSIGRRPPPAQTWPTAGFG